MEYPHGHNPPRHHHRRRDENEEDNYPPPPFFGNNEPPPPPFYGRPEPPPPFYGGNQPPPPPFHGGNVYPPQVHHTSHVGPDHDPYSNYSPSPAPPQVHHTSHVGPDHDSYSNYAPAPAPPADEPHHHRPHMPHFPGHRKDDDDENEVNRKPTVRMYSKAEPNYSLTIRDHKVILARSNPNDPTQHWIKEEKWSTRVKDEEGFPSFALINKATGQALKHATGATHPVQLTSYNPNVLDESILWTESKDLGDTHRAIRMVNNIRLNIDAFNGDKQHGGVHDGTTIVLWEWKKGDNQRWKIVPY